MTNRFARLTAPRVMARLVRERDLLHAEVCENDDRVRTTFYRHNEPLTPTNQRLLTPLLAALDATECTPDAFVAVLIQFGFARLQ